MRACVWFPAAYWCVQGQSTYLMLPVTLMVSSAVLLRTRGTLDDKGGECRVYLQWWR